MIRFAVLDDYLQVVRIGLKANSKHNRLKLHTAR